VLVAIAGVFELGAAFKELENQLVRFSAHHGGWEDAELRLLRCANNLWQFKAEPLAVTFGRDWVSAIARIYKAASV
jgi:hypothetical protein